MHCACKCYALLKVKKNNNNNTYATVSSQVTVSSGGMLTQKLNVDDLQCEKGTFDGTMAYAQNKVKETDLEQLYTGELNRNHCGVYPCFVEVLCVVIFFFFWTETAGDSDRDVGLSAQRDPLLLHAPRLGRHTR